jgi:hypothetical protein
MQIGGKGIENTIMNMMFMGKKTFKKHIFEMTLFYDSLLRNEFKKL